MDMEDRNAKLILQILEDQEERTLEDEEIIHLLLDKKLSRNIATDHAQELGFSEKSSDVIAKFIGSWSFILIFMGCLVGWVILNALLLIRAVDPYPFILLNLILSCLAAIQAR